MKRDKLKEDLHLNKMIEDWKKKKRCVGVCYLVKVKMMKDKKFRREADELNQALHEREADLIHNRSQDTDDITSTSSPLFSEKLWNSYVKKQQKIIDETVYAPSTAWQNRRNK